MTVRSLLIRFALAYAGLIAAAAAVLVIFDLGKSSAINIALLIGARSWACLSFAQKNGRYLTAQEKKTTILGMIGIDLAIQVILAFGLLGATQADVPVMLLLGALVFVELLHACAIWFFVGFLGRTFEKQQAAQGK